MIFILHTFSRQMECLFRLSLYVFSVFLLSAYPWGINVMFFHVQMLFQNSSISCSVSGSLTSFCSYGFLSRILVDVCVQPTILEKSRSCFQVPYTDRFDLYILTYFILSMLRNSVFIIYFIFFQCLLLLQLNYFYVEINTYVI